MNHGRRRGSAGTGPGRKRMLRFTRRFGVSHSRGDLTGYSPATDLPGPPHSPLLPSGLRAPSPGGGLMAPELPRLLASVRSPCSTAPGSHSLGFRIQLGFEV